MGRGLSKDPSPAAVPDWPCTLLRCFGLRSGSVCCSCLAETLPSRRRDPTVAGGGYSQSLPPCSHALQMVPTPLLTHLTLERRQRRQAMLERIRPGACVGDGPAAALCRPVVDMVAVLEVRRPAGRSEGCNRVGKPSVFALWDVSGVQLMVGRVSGHEADSQDRAEQSSSRGQTADWRQKSARRGAHTKSQLRGVARRYLSKSNGGQARRAAAARRHDRAEDLAIRGHDGRRLKG